MNFGGLNSASLFPPRLSAEEVARYLNSKRPRKNCHGYMLLKLSVARECQRSGTNEIMIASAANYFWSNSTSLEKSGYVDLAQRRGN
ncbi:hypothetical protein Glove_37g131 [Diversispora epigaea]|uniref:Uncharacterized protein n=1 Tax=Diversispora epigaea TaxID=1348612 RepID=A0A397JR21_9GLOM|nr:hypothetical protein Glove_37g131 [Diversispora epigaea]